MLTIDVIGKVLGVLEEDRTFVSESGQKKDYKKRVVRLLVGDEFVVLTARDGTKLPADQDKGKICKAKLVAFSNEKDVVRGVCVDFDFSGGK